MHRQAYSKKETVTAVGEGVQACDAESTFHNKLHERRAKALTEIHRQGSIVRPIIASYQLQILANINFINTLTLVLSVCVCVSWM